MPPTASAPAPTPACANAGSRSPAYKLMRALEDSDQSMREVSEILHVSPRTVTDMIDSLEARGLVARGPHPADRRDHPPAA